MLFSGDVIARAKQIASEKNKKGNPQITVEFTVASGQKTTDDDGREVSVGGQKVYWFGTITSKTRKRVVESLQHMGLTEADAERFVSMAESGEFGVLPDGMGQEECQVACEINEYEGKRTTRVSFVNAREGRRPKGPVLTGFSGGSASKPAVDPYS